MLPDSKTIGQQLGKTTPAGSVSSASPPPTSPEKAEQGGLQIQAADTRTPTTWRGQGTLADNKDWGKGVENNMPVS